MKKEELESIFDKILNKSSKLIENKKHGNILNERVFHHMFSNEVSSYFSEKKIDIWESLLLLPEYPTDEKFTWKFVDKYFEKDDAKRAREEGVGKGRAGQFDFVIKELNEPRIFIEFKGPKLYKSIDIAKVMLKLLSQNDKSSLKVFTAIITSKMDKHDLENNLKRGLDFSLEVLNIKNPRDINLYVYVAKVPNNKPVFWGKYTQ